MQCPVCGQQNPTEARFCMNCGSRLPTICPVCSASSDPDARFCANCGTALTGDATRPGEAPADDLTRYIPEELLAKIRSARAGRAMAGERRIVTMLFADVQGSTAAAENLDPEDWVDIMNGVFEHLIAPIYRYEGTLAQLQGDAILAFFGAPIAHEDDPIRAVRAGLEIVEGIGPYQGQVLDRWGVPVAVRVGINTGLVVVGEVGSDLRVEYTALGDAINVAARMEQTAEPGTVRIASATRDLVADAFDLEEMGPVEVKGKSRPVPVYRAIRFRGEDRGRRELHPLVGRTAELEALAGVIARMTDGVGCITSVIADAGVGKSRVIDELRRRVAAERMVAVRADQEGEISWMYAASRSYDSTIPYATVRDLLRSWLGAEASPDAFDRVGAAVESAGMDDPDAAVYLAHLADVPLPPAAARLIEALQAPVLHQRVAAAVAGYLEAEAARRPLAVVLEDLHWADSMSLTLAEGMMGIAERRPLGLIVAMRPYRDEPTWRIHEVAERSYPHRYQPVRLESLSREETESLLSELVGDQPVPESTRRRIVERSDGNPLFIEQMARALREHGGEAGEEQVPASLGALLTARLDRLDQEPRLVAQMASVLGSVVDRDALAYLIEDRAGLDAHLTDLLRKGILVEERGPTGGRLQFRHALMQEAAYGTILHRTRRTLHRRVADFLIESGGESVEDIARHLVEAQEPQAAFPYLVEAGHRATRAMALSTAIELFNTALENVPADADPELVVRAHDGLGNAHALVPDLTRSAAAFQRLLRYGEETGDAGAQVAALNRLGFNSAALAGDFLAAKDYLEQARRLAESSGDEMGLAEYHMNSCMVASLTGDLERAVAHDDETARIGAKRGADEIRILGLMRKAINLIGLADFEAARPALIEAHEAAEKAGAVEAVAILEALGFATLRMLEGDPKGALEMIAAGRATLERYDSFYFGTAMLREGAVSAELGDIESALSTFASARRYAERTGQPFVTAAAAAAMARLYAESGMIDPVEGLQAEAEQALAMPAGEYLGSSALADLGYCDLALGRSEAALTRFSAAEGSSSASKLWERPRILAGAALAETARGDTATAHERLDEAVGYVAEKGIAVARPMLDYARGRALLAEERFAEADQALAAALSSAEGMGFRPLVLRISVARRAAAEALSLDEAAHHADVARATLASIVSTVVDPDLRASLERRWLASLEGTRA